MGFFGHKQCQLYQYPDICTISRKVCLYCPFSSYKGPITLFFNDINDIFPKNLISRLLLPSRPNSVVAELVFHQLSSYVEILDLATHP